MPKLIRWRDGAAAWDEDRFTSVAGDLEAPADDLPRDLPPGDLILSIARFQTDGERLLDEGRRIGVRVSPNETVESLAYDLPRLALVALEFPKFKDGRAYSAARILRERLGFEGELRAVGDVLREQARFMIRCGFDAFEPADGATPRQWEDAADRFRHVYQRAADGLSPAFAQRLSHAAAG